MPQLVNHLVVSASIMLMFCARPLECRETNEGLMLPYEFVQAPTAPPTHKLGAVTAVALLPSGNIIVLNRNPEIMMIEYNARGEFIRAFNPNIAGNPHGLRVDRHGNIWVTDSFLNIVWKLNPHGDPLLMIGTRGAIGAWNTEAWNGKLNQPVDVAFDQNDNVYIVQGHGGSALPTPCDLCANYSEKKLAVPAGSDPRIVKFDKFGKYQKSVSLSRSSGSYPTIHTVAVTKRGEVWVGDRQSRTIIIFDSELRRLREILVPALVSGLFVDNTDHIWMATGHNGTVLKLNDLGEVLGRLGNVQPNQNNDLNFIGEAHYVVVTPDEKTIFVADTANRKIHQLERRAR